MDQIDEALEELLPEAFAAVREAMVRALGKRHYDVQLIGGAVLHRGAIAEMRTGEGKTFVAPLAAYLNGLAGRGVHVVTVNDYLAKRDAQWIGAVFHRLGMEVGSIQHEAAFVFDPDYPATDERLRDLRPVTRREAYPADVTYGTNNEFGFDYLRDNLVVDLSLRVQRGHFFAIVDEVDNILIDEARTPLIISGQAEQSTDRYIQFARLVPRLRAEEDYILDEKFRQVAITEVGHRQDGALAGGGQPVRQRLQRWRAISTRPSRPQVLYKRDHDYVVKDGEVVIVDEFTGRLMPGRRWSEGLHQAVEAKEGVQIQSESQTLATVTFQNYFRMYDKLAGMTGTAETEAEEFNKIYNLEVVVIPTNVPMVRDDFADLVYSGQQAKWQLGHRRDRRGARARPPGPGRHDQRRDQRDAVSEMLKRRGVKHNVLNAKLHEREAEIISQAGRSGARDHRHQHGRPRHRHPARRQPGHPGRRPPPPAGDHHPGGHPRADRGRAGRSGGHLRRGPRQGHRRRRPAHPRDRSGTRRGGSTTSCAAARDGRATRAAAASTCPSRTTSCAGSPATGSRAS